MHIAELIFLSIALGVDCLVVSFSQGLIFTKKQDKKFVCSCSNHGNLTKCNASYRLHWCGFVK